MRELIFTENRYDRSIERMMKGVPNFYPRSSGIVVTGNFKYTAEMCDCKLCSEYIPKKGCGVPHCVCLEERVAVGVASVKEIMNDTMSEIKHSGFLRRVRRYIKESEAIPMTFINEKHRLNFDEAISRLNKLDQKNDALMSAIYLLTADSNLTETTSSGVWASLSGNQQQAINTALCYGREGNFSNIKGSSSINSDQCYIATQLIIWEIVNGERSATAPFSLNGNGYLSMYCANGYNGNIAEAYHRIENEMASAQTVPSFASKYTSNAPEYTLIAKYNSVKRTWSYTPLTLTDSNSVMAKFAGFNNKTVDVGNATVTVKVNGNKVTLTPSAAKLNATSKTVMLNTSKSGVPTTNEAKLIAYASSYQDVVSGGSVSTLTAYFKVRVATSQNSKLDTDFRIRKVIGTQNEYDSSNEDVIDGVVSTAENLKGWYFKVEVSNVSTFYRYYKVRSFVLGPTDEAGLTQTVLMISRDKTDSSIRNCP